MDITKVVAPKFHGKDDINIIGVRFQNSRQNFFDDFIVTYMNGVSKFYQATTSPGTFWLNNPSRVSGTARLKPGFYKRCWVLGTHKGQYQALVQSNEALFVVQRDNDKNDLFNEQAESFNDASGINLHHAGESSTKVDKWSAGCQVIARMEDWNDLMSDILLSRKSYGNFFSYNLVLMPNRLEFLEKCR